MAISSSSSSFVSLLDIWLDRTSGSSVEDTDLPVGVVVIVVAIISIGWRGDSLVVVVNLFVGVRGRGVGLFVLHFLKSICTIVAWQHIT